MNRNAAPRDRSSIKLLSEDIRRFRRHLGDPQLHVVGLSWGAKLAIASALDQPGALESLIIITPGLKARVRLPFKDKVAFFLGLLGLGTSRVKIPIAPEMFTETPRFLRFIREDPWRLREVSAHFLWNSLYLDRVVRARIGELRLPVLLFTAANDRIIDNQGVLDALAPLREGQLRVHRFDNAGHSVQFDELETLVDRIADFVEARDGAP